MNPQTLQSQNQSDSIYTPTTTGGDIWSPYWTPPNYVTPTYVYPTVYFWPPVPVEPVDCIGKAHVFECDHEPRCKCGKIRRVMSKAKRRAERAGDPR